MLDKRILIVDNVLNAEECKNLIGNFHFARLRQLPEYQIYRDTELLQIRPDQEYTWSCVQKIASLVLEYDVEWSQVVEWKVGSSQAYHRDKTSDKTVLTSITYLNDDYVGGQTSIENDIDIVPKLGRTVYFDGLHYVHGVKKIEKGVRYTLPIWYKMGL